MRIRFLSMTAALFSALALPGCISTIHRHEIGKDGDIIHYRTVYDSITGLRIRNEHAELTDHGRCHEIIRNRYGARVIVHVDCPEQRARDSAQRHGDAGPANRIGQWESLKR